MNAARKYVSVLAVIGIVIALPAVAGRILGAPIGLLGLLGLLQVVICWLFALTSPVSLGFSLWALAKKEWKKAGVYSTGALLPWLTLGIILIASGEAMEAVMGI